VLLLADLAPAEIFVLSGTLCVVPVTSERKCLLTITPDSRLHAHVFIPGMRNLAPVLSYPVGLPWNFTEIFTDLTFSLRPHLSSLPTTTILAASIYPPTGELLVLDSTSSLFALKALPGGVLALQKICTLDFSPQGPCQIALLQPLVCVLCAGQALVFIAATGSFIDVSCPGRQVGLIS
jgi:hypothetical protein